MDKIEEKLQALAKVQYIDSKLDKIFILRGSLPEEVGDLEDDVEGLREREEKIKQDIKGLEEKIAKRKENIKSYGDQIKRYEKQLNEVKNNREYEALTKEVEYANLEILTSEKKIGQYGEIIEQKKELLSKNAEEISEKNKDLEAKQQELKKIMKETEKEEKALRSDSEKAAKLVDQHIQDAYKKIRNNMRNGLAVVSPYQGACGGCFATIPPQVQLEIRQRRKLIFCENCGRIIVDQGFFDEFASADAEAVTA